MVNLILNMDCLESAILSSDIDSAEASLEKIWEWVQKHGDIPDLYIDRIVYLHGSLQRLKDRGPVIEDPNAAVRDIATALDAEDYEGARGIMAGLQGSWASNGPHPDQEHRRILVRNLLGSWG